MASCKRVRQNSERNGCIDQSQPLQSVNRSVSFNIASSLQVVQNLLQQNQSSRKSGIRKDADTFGMGGMDLSSKLEEEEVMATGNNLKQSVGGKRGIEIIDKLEGFDISPRNNLVHMKPVDPLTKVLNTSAVMGQPTLGLMDYSKEFRDSITNNKPCAIPAINPNTLRCPPVCSRTVKRDMNRLKRQRFLENWYDLKRQKPTLELLQHIKIYNLRGHARPNKFYTSGGFAPVKSTSAKNKKTETGAASLFSPTVDFPSHFHVARVVNGGLSEPVGENSKLPSTDVSNRLKRGKSVIRELIRDTEIQKWTERRSNEVFQFEASGNKKWYNKKCKAQARLFKNRRR